MLKQKLSNFSYNASLDIQRNAPLYLVVLFIFLVGFSSGTFTPGMLSNQSDASFGTYLNAFFTNYNKSGLDFGSILFQSLFGNLFVYSLICMAGIWIFALPISVAALLFKGFTTGFTAAILVSHYGLKGVLVFFIGVVLPALVLLPCFLKAAVLSAREFLERAKMRMNKVKTKHSHIKYVSDVSTWFMISLIGVLIEAGIVPLALRLISGVMTGS